MSDFRKRLEEELKEIETFKSNLEDRGVKLKNFITSIVEKNEIPPFLDILDYSMLVTQNEIMASLLEGIMLYEEMLEQRISLINSKKGEDK